MAAKTKKTSAATAKKTIKAATPAWKPAKTVTPTPAAPAAPVAKQAVLPLTPAAKAPAVPPAIKPTAVSAPIQPKTVTSAGKAVSPAERQKMIEIAAYVLAEKNHFRGDAKNYWLQAEQEVDVKLGRK
jgi:hypothetical protein